MRLVSSVALAVALSACSQARGIRPDDTQVVAQWRTSDYAFAFINTELTISRTCADLCFDDGNDIGSGTFNVYLYTQDVPATVRMLARLENAREIPVGLASVSPGTRT